jgi:predicted helicase
MRQVSLDESYSHVFVSKNMVDNRTFLSSKGIIQQAPLYFYPESDKRDLFSDLPGNGTRKPNIVEKVYKLLRVKLNSQDITPEEIFYYIYAVLYSNIYREKYTEFLRIDFPRIPFTSDLDLFIQLGKLGEQLAAIHLMKSLELDDTFSKFEVSGDALVKKVNYIQKEKRVYINDNQYFSNIDKEIWEYHIGGYQVMAKWLKDRKKRHLSLEDIRHYIKIARTLQLTIQYQDKIDELYEGVEKNLIQL